MTFREEFEKKHPDAVRVARCPRDKKLMECDRTLFCSDCWDREIPKKRNSQKKEIEGRETTIDEAIKHWKDISNGITCENDKACGKGPKQ